MGVRILPMLVIVVTGLVIWLVVSIVRHRIVLVGFVYACI